MATLEKIQAQIKKLEAQAQALVTTKSATALTKIRDLMAKHGLTTADIDAHVGKRGGRTARLEVSHDAPAVAAKYQDPKTGATWSGRGRTPAWIANEKNRNKFLVANAESTAQPEHGKRVGNYPRGPQPAKYRDPSTGATWSGRGRVPAWLADVQDRDSFLIAGGNAATKAVRAKVPVAGETSQEKSPTAKKAVTATKKVAKKATATKAARKGVSKKVASKKTAAKKVVAKKGAAKKSAATARKSPGRKAAVKPASTGSAASLVDTTVSQAA